MQKDFVRHAQAEHSEDDRTRPLTAEGEKDSGIVPELLKDKEISVFYCSPYRRSLDTIRLCAEQYHMEIHLDERLRERTVGVDGTHINRCTKDGKILIIMRKTESPWRWFRSAIWKPCGNSWRGIRGKISS